jgi:hypothetical protein
MKEGYLELLECLDALLLAEVAVQLAATNTQQPQDDSDTVAVSFGLNENDRPGRELFRQQG